MTREALQRDDSIFLPQLFRTLRRYRWTVILTTLFCFGLAVAAAFLMRPVYRGEVVFAPAGQDSISGT